jgi:cephalosporin-C deacetylase-like acetyl esterase
MNRRQFLAESGASLLGQALLRKRGFMEAVLAAETTRSYAEDMPDMLDKFLTTKLNRLTAAWEQRRAQLQTVDELKKRNATVLHDVLKMVGAFPPKSFLRATTVRSIEKNGYRIENVLFCSRPDFWVTANLYVPTTGKGPFPAILSPCGHYPLARMLPQYQSAYISLVRSGFVVLAYDPIGQGEREQYRNSATNMSDVGGPVFEHSMLGQQLLLLGETLTGYMLWDGMRAIDYLLTRPEVDAARIGCAGHSGGGTITKFLTVVDNRVQCAAILEGGTTNAWPTQSIGLGDAEQNLFPAALYGIDNVDLHVAIAPRPLLVGIEHQGPAFDKAVAAIRSRYSLLSVEEKFSACISGDPHAWTPKLRLATTDWFSQWFYHRRGPLAEDAQDTCSPKELYCTRNGSLHSSGMGVTLSEIISKKQAELMPAEKAAVSAALVSESQREIRARVVDLLRYQKENRPLNARHLDTVPREGYVVEHIEFLSEPGIYIPLWVFVPEHRNEIQSAILYFSDEGMQADGMEFEGGEGSGMQHGLLDELARKGYLIVAADVRGVGETAHGSSSSLSSEPFGQLFDADTALAYAAWSMNESLLGMRVSDVIRSVDYVLQREDAKSSHLHVIGKGTAALWCIYAASLDDRISSVTCNQGLLSYRSLVESDRYLYSADIFVPEVLLHFDLPEVAAAIAPRSLTFIAPVDAMKKTVDLAKAREIYRSTGEAYKAFGAEANFKIRNRDLSESLCQQLMGALQTANLRTSDMRHAKTAIHSSDASVFHDTHYRQRES